MTAPDHRPSTSGRLTLRQRAAIERSRGRRVRNEPVDSANTDQLGLIPGIDDAERAEAGEQSLDTDPITDLNGTVRVDPDAEDPLHPAALRAVRVSQPLGHPWFLIGVTDPRDMWASDDDVRGWPVQPPADLARVYGHPTEQPSSVGQPEPFEITDVSGDEVRVNSLPGAARISVKVDDVIWLDPDEADQLADALRAHAAARRAEATGGGTR